jgi:hypothetical protein
MLAKIHSKLCSFFCSPKKSGDEGVALEAATSVKKTVDEIAANIAQQTAQPDHDRNSAAMRIEGAAVQIRRQANVLDELASVMRGDQDRKDADEENIRRGGVGA